MSGKLICLTTIFCIAIGSLYNAARADLPAKVFSPYVYIQKDNSDLTNIYKATGQKYFEISGVNGDDKGHAIWSNGSAITSHFFDGQIAAIRAAGGDVSLTFGGEKHELSEWETDVTKLQAEYQSVIDAYQLKWLDMDVEDGSLEDPVANQRRNMAFVGLQKANPNLVFMYTVPGDPDGIAPEALTILRDAKKRGLKVSIANVMTMDYGASFSRGKKMGDLAVTTAAVSYKQCQAIDPDIKIGVTSIIGQNDERGEIFNLEDAKIVMDWASRTDWVRLVSFWQANRDNGRKGVYARADDAGSGIVQPDWAFTNIFKTFTTGFTPATRP